MLLNEKNKKYKLLVEKFYERCQDVQTENERCVLRINTIKKIKRRRLREVELLKRRLDKHNDNWKAMPMVAPHPKRKIEQKRGPKPKAKNPNEEPKEKKARKQRMRKNAHELGIVGGPGVTVIPELMSTTIEGDSDIITMDPHHITHFTEQQAQQLLLMQRQHIQFKQ